MLGYPHFFFNIRIEYELKMWFHNRLRPAVVFNVIILSSKVKKYDFYLFSKKFKRFLQFNYQYLSNLYLIFFEFWICYSWIIALSMIYSTLFILTIGSWSKLRLKFFCQSYSGLRVKSMGIEFCENPELTW